MSRLHVALFALGAAMVAYGLSDCRRSEAAQPAPGHIYDTSFGQVFCARHDWNHCGVFLHDCHDGHEYHCLQNVRQRDAK
jgi:hypothetical protein